MKELLNKIGSDKYAHFVLCAIVALLVGACGMLMGASIAVIGFSGFAAAMGAGLGKEYGDKVNPYNKWDWWDVLADVLGAVFGSGVSMLLAWIF